MKPRHRNKICVRANRLLLFYYVYILFVLFSVNHAMVLEAIALHQKNDHWQKLITKGNTQSLQKMHSYNNKKIYFVLIR